MPALNPEKSIAFLIEEFCNEEVPGFPRLRTFPNTVVRYLVNRYDALPLAMRINRRRGSAKRALHDFGPLAMPVPETTRDERQALGFYLELTGHLGGDRRLSRRASGLRDRRRTALRPFFSGGRGSFARAAAHEKSPALARRWGFLMNMELESFATAFRKHVRVAA